MTRTDTGTLRFGPFDLGPDGRLLRQGRPVALQPKELALLRLLLRSAGRVVTKREFLDRVWAAEAVGEASLTSGIYALRTALGDRGRRGRYIETVHGRGYRFVAPVERAEGEPATERSRVRIAVIPFEEETRSPAHLGEGLIGDVISRLGHWRRSGIDAIARQSAARLWRDWRDREQLVRELQLDFVATGRIRQEGRDVEVSAELTRVSDSVVVWSQEFACPADAMALLAREIAEALAKRLVGLRGEVLRPLPKSPEASDPRAYSALLRGRFLNQFRTESGLRRSIHCFEQALGWDPRCAAAHAALAESHLNLGWRGYAAPLAIASPARVAVERALELDRRHGAAWAALAFLRLMVDWDPAAASEALAAAEDCDAAHDRVAWLRAIVQVALGRFDAALDAIESAQAIDPFSPNLAIARVCALWFGGRDDEALQAARELAQAEREFATAQAIHGNVAATVGRVDEALRATDAADALARNDQLTRTTCAWTYAVAGRPDLARGILASLERRSGERYVSPTFAAIGYAGLGDREAALAWLERAPAVRCMWVPFVGVDVRLAALRGEPRFDAIRRLVAASDRSTRPRRRRTAPAARPSEPPGAASN